MKLISTFAERFTEALQKRNKKQSDIVALTGIGKSSISTYLTGEYEPKQKNTYKIAKALNVSETWLMGYDVPMERDTNDIAPATSTSSKGAIVLVYGTIPAGVPIECIENILDTEEIPIEMLKGGKEYFGLRIKGDSMFPEYLDGDTLILQKVDDCESGDDCVVTINGSDGTFKRVIKNENGIILQPLNTTYTPLVFTNQQISDLPVKILGVCVEIRRRKKK